jgi:hypothetical protein
MSSQLQVSGEAKIRDIQGPVVANSGVITALDGAASQYVRGDGTLADFPTSSGGGSSVSYYLNSSVSQGTIGGVAYRELSKEPIIGAGTDITISANGYVANYITDVNDPDVILIPGGNFNCEFYFSVNNNTGNPFFYAELYKYDGTTFTLLGSSVGVPEYITQGTTIAPYYFAIPVATATLALTDRLAIRIYVNVSGRTVTLHTENGHLCQVVTTLSKGMVSLNNLTDQSQFLAVGTSGTNFAIVSSGDTHTFNLPVASATNTGKLSSTDWNTFNGKVPYTGAIADVDLGLNNFTAFGGTFNSILTINATGNQARALYMVTGTAGSQYGSGTGVNLFSEATDNLSILFTTASTTRKAILNGANLTTAKTFTLPDASGTIALTSNINYPVTSVFGRTGAVLAVSGDYNTSQVTENTNLYFTDARSRAALSFTAGSGAYNSTTGVITIPTDNNQIANGAGYITSSALSGYLPLSGGTLTGGLNGTTATFSGLGTFYQLTMTGATAGRLFYAQTGGVFSQSGNLVWNNSTEQLGVGTPNPSAVVTAFSTNAATQLKAAGTAPAITFSNTLTSASLACVFGLATANNHFITGTAAGDMAIANQSTSAGAIVFGTGTFEKMRMSSGGNFGIGTSNPTSKLTVAGDATISAGTISAFSFGVNSNSTFAFGSLNGRRAVIFAHETIGDSGLQFGWDTVDKTGIIAGSATSVGCGIDFYTFNGSSWGNRMRITKDGNVGIGTSSPTARLEVYGGESNMGLLNISGVYGGIIRFLGSGVNKWGITVEDGLGSDKFGIFDYGATGGTGYRLVIDNSGNVGIGTSSPRTAASGSNRTLDIKGGIYFGDTASESCCINNNDSFICNFDANNDGGTSNFFSIAKGRTGESGGSEYFRVTGSGNVLVGNTTDRGYRFQANSNSGTYAMEVRQNVSTAASIALSVTHEATSGTRNMIFFYSGGYGESGSITSGNTTTSYNTSSDYRLKQDLKDYSGLNLISAIKTYDFEWEADNSRMYGVMAHELAEVIPYAVVGEKDGIDENGKIIKQGVDYSKLVPILVKAVQEQQAQIEELKAKIK